MSRPLSLLLTLLMLVGMPAVLCADQPKGRNLALLVGVKTYDHPPLPSLPYTENDVLELAKKLQEADYKTVVLCDAAGEKNKNFLPLGANIRAQLKGLLKECKENDTVLIALSGHGLQFDKKQTAYFCPRDAKTDDKTTLIALKDMYDDLAASKAGVKIVLVDACRNNPSIDRGIGGDDDQAPPKGIIAMFSCKAGQRAYETAKFKHGLFFHFVLEGLQDEQTQDAEGNVTWDRLAGYVSRHVTEEAPKMAGGKVPQEPHIVAETEGAPPVVWRPRDDVRKAIEARKRGQAALGNVQYEKAAREYSTAITFNPKDPNLYAGRAKASLLLHDFDRSINDYSTALKMTPENADLWLSRGDAYFQNYQLKEAVSDFGEVLRLEPETAPALQKRAFCYYLLQEDDRAYKDIQSAIQLAKDDPNGYGYRAALLIRKRKYDEAIDDCNRALKLDNSCGIAYNCRGLAYRLKNETARAMKDYDRGIQVDPNCVYNYFNRGLLYAEQGKFDLATKDIEKGLEKSPRLADGYAYLATTKFFQQKLDDAFKAANQALDIQPRHAWALIVRGYWYVSKNEKDRALKDFDGAIAIAPEDATYAYQGRGLVHYAQQEFDQALKDFDRSIETGIGDPMPYVHRSNVHKAKKNFDEAFRDCNRAIELDAKCAMAYNNRGVLFADVKGDGQKALRDYNAAINLAPDNVGFLMNRAALYAKYGYKNEAQADWQRIRQLTGK